ncbi:MAG: hypothetical protein AB7P17_02825 [Nitrospirales bacterium]|nr:hypothetical protein [Nitrospirales bacterium]
MSFSSSRNMVWFFLLFIACVGLWLYSTTPVEKVYLPDDPQAQVALDLVKSHASRKDGTVAEALSNMVEQLRQQGVTLREGDWRVATQGEDTYVVSKIIREKGSVEWIEREFAWRVNVKERWVKVISLAAQGLMPFENLPPLPHGSEISRSVSPSLAAMPLG